MHVYIANYFIVQFQPQEITRFNIINISMQLDTKLIQKLTNSLYCSKNNHNQEQIHYLCVDDNCVNKQLCCFICQEEAHPKHEMKSIKILISQINQSQNVQAQVLIMSATLDQIGTRFEIFIEAHKESIQDIRHVSDALHQFLGYKRDNILGVLGLPKQLRTIIEGKDIDLKEKLVQFYHKYENYLSVEDLTKQKQCAIKKSIYNLNLSKIVQELKQIQLSLERLEKNDRINDANILALFPLNQTIFRSFRPFFSQNLKGTCMKITPTTAQMHTSSSQRVLALEPSLEGNAKIKRWKIKITKLSSWIGVGACHIQKLKQANWHFNYSTTKHGSYFISSNGYSWSSFKTEYNSKFEPFSYKTGDIIKLEYNPREKLLKFEKEAENDIKTYSLQIQDNGDMLHPAINLTGVGDSVEIID